MSQFEARAICQAPNFSNLNFIPSHQQWPGFCEQVFDPLCTLFIVQVSNSRTGVQDCFFRAMAAEGIQSTGAILAGASSEEAWSRKDLLRALAGQPHGEKIRAEIKFSRPFGMPCLRQANFLKGTWFLPSGNNALSNESGQIPFAA